MSWLSSWFDLAFKLILLSIYFIGIWRLGDKEIFKSDRFPIFLIAFLPFFGIYKFISALGKESLLNESYTITAIIIPVIIFLVSTTQQRSHYQLRQDFQTLFKQHRLVIGCLGCGFVFFLMRGLYLEYPGDAIEYLQRVGQANQDLAGGIQSLWRHDSDNTFFSSFQQWLVGSDYWMREKLRVVAAFNVCMLSLAAYRLALWAIGKKTIAVISMLLFLGFYGNLQISFFMYKILQGATLAMIVYLELVPLLYRLFSGVSVQQLSYSKRNLELILILVGIWMCRDCHQEKVLYVVTIAFAYALLTVFKHIAQRQLPSIRSIAFLLISFAPFLLLFFSAKEPRPGHPLTKEWLSIGNYELFTYWPLAANSGVILLDIVVIGLAIILLSSYGSDSKAFFLAAIAIAPFLLFLNPIAVTGLIKLTFPVNVYRLMLAGLPWLFLPFAVHTLKRDYAIRLDYLLIVFICLGFFVYAPIYGKFPHILKRVPPYADGRDLMPVVDYLLKDVDHDDRPQLKVMAPPYVGSYVAAWPTFQVASNRWIDNNIVGSRADLSYLYGSEITAAEITAILTSGNYDVIVIDARDGLTYRSWLARMTGHWPVDLIMSQRALLAGQSLRSYLADQPQPMFEKTLEQNGFQVYQTLIQ
ncbi:hypothetical protein [Halomicronema sp. CCY15110]|uniref:hypothetical protein n=1 Tax=Halomicronema sp. CCY15110 TaxID=2767773 RepID=UPI001951D5F1|nr:hypothetical protein [Halomicronema sp. CCY15110]